MISLGVLARERRNLLRSYSPFLFIIFALPEELLVVGHLYDQRNIQGRLEPLRHEERYKVP